MKRHLIQYIVFCLLFFGLLNTFSEDVPAQNLQTLELVTTYQSEEEFRLAHPLPVEAENTIIEEGGYFKFIHSETGKVYKQIQKDDFVLTEEEKQRLHETRPLIKNGMYYTPSDVFQDTHDFLIATEFTASLYKSEFAGKSEVTKKVLYNAQGEVVTDLPRNVDFMKVSPDKQYFVAYELLEASPDIYTVYFYTRNGILLTQQNMGGKYELVKYSQNGEYVVLFHVHGRTIGIFTMKGDIIYEGYYRDLIHRKSPRLHNVFVSENGQMLMLKTDKYIHLCTTSGKLLWEESSSELSVECLFLSRKGVIVIKNRHHLEIRSLDNGTLIEHVTGVSQISLVGKHLFIFREGIYYEYKID